MKLIIEPRGVGKTTELIKLASEHFGYIVCQSQKRAGQINEYAKRLGLNIPFPITYQDFIEKQYYPAGIKAFLIDDVDMLLNYMTRVPIIAITMTKEVENDNTTN